jgi:hypothetical protein
MATVTGVEAVQDKLRQYIRDVGINVRAANSKSADELVNKVHSTVPEDTGDLAATIAKGEGRTELGFSVSVGDAAHPYAPAIEYGHQDHGMHVPPRPFFWTSVRVLAKRFRSRQSRAVNAAIRGLKSDGGDS